MGSSFDIMEVRNRPIDALLVDIDGVLYVGDTAIEGAVEALDRLRVPHLYLTNTTTRSARSLQTKLNDLGFKARPEQILTAPVAARRYLESQGSPPARLVLRDEVKEEFSGYPQSEKEAQVVVIGDIGTAWSYPLLDEIFRLLMAGAELIALHKNKFWQKSDGLHLDIGAFIRGLEYSSGKDAQVMGKPSKAFFDAALSTMQVSADRAAMIGDDIDSDVGGAQQHGIFGILVKTGKYREEYAARSGVTPDLVLPSIANLML